MVEHYNSDLENYKNTENEILCKGLTRQDPPPPTHTHVNFLPQILEMARNVNKN